jgi:hypothetical protein
MADPEHVAILKQGVEVWNKWRKMSRPIHLDLKCAKLAGADLHGADLARVNRCKVRLFALSQFWGSLQARVVEGTSCRFLAAANVSGRREKTSNIRRNMAGPENPRIAYPHS